MNICEQTRVLSIYTVRVHTQYLNAVFLWQLANRHTSDELTPIDNEQSRT